MLIILGTRLVVELLPEDKDEKTPGGIYIVNQHKSKSLVAGKVVGVGNGCTEPVKLNDIVYMDPNVVIEIRLDGAMRTIVDEKNVFAIERDEKKA